MSGIRDFLVAFALALGATLTVALGMAYWVTASGGKFCSTTEQRFFGKSTKKRQWPITMRSNSPTARSCY